MNKTKCCTYHRGHVNTCHGRTLQNRRRWGEAGDYTYKVIDFHQLESVLALEGRGKNLDLYPKCLKDKLS